MKYLLVLVFFVVGCSSAPMTSDVADAGVATDAPFIQSDSGQDAYVAITPDAAVRAPDAFRAQPFDAGMPDAYALMAEPDAHVTPDAYVPPVVVADAGMPDAPPAPVLAVKLGVSGDASCVLNTRDEVWCWGAGHSTKVLVGTATDIEGTCGLALDGSIFCWNGTRTNYPANAGLIGEQQRSEDLSGALDLPSYVGAVDGVMHTMREGADWAPAPREIVSIPSAGCSLQTDGSALCWEPRLAATLDSWTLRSRFMGTGTATVTDIASRGSFAASTTAWNSALTCYRHESGSTGSVVCQRGFDVGVFSSPAFVNPLEVDVAGPRACTLSTTGVACATDGWREGDRVLRFPVLPARLHKSLEALVDTDPVGNFTPITGASQLQLGNNHACVLQAGVVLCWGQNELGQLGTPAVHRVPAPIE